ncbi:MAG: hypothetical protein JWL72_3230 [Ilumatobacteraceae bacterium]|nr:hypothetical protein [Ilumatobacteraceae bacterium]
MQQNGWVTTDYADVPGDVLDALTEICMSLPDAHEQPAWTGIRWRVRQRTFAHVLGLAAGSDKAHARAAKADGDVVIVVFRSSGAELLALKSAGHPFFYAGWGRDVVGMVLDAGTDWSEVRELLTESYCLMAPKKLAALVQRPEP